jgi:glyoxylate carboligase
VDLAMRLSPLDPLYYAMLGTRGFTHLAQGEAAAAAQLAERAAHWAADVRERNPVLTRADFFRAFPMQPDALRSRISAALARLGF